MKIRNFAKNENKRPIYPKIKKEPIISQIPTTNINKERISENKNIQKEFSKSNFSSPSLDILENEKVNSKRKIEKENIE